ncbi:MAG: inner membrane protein [Maribacter sp.]|jgi:inner membrane protein
MDSLSQIVLGAAVGEAVLGKKIGNRALAIGAVAGTIPDLDIIANPFLSEIQALDFHRGISHSLFFSVVAPLLFAGITYFFFKKEIHKSKKYRASIGVIPLIMISVLMAAAIYAAVKEQAYIGMGITIGIFLVLSIPILKYIFKKPSEFEDPSYMNWYWLFFWAFITHIILDAFTNYGTQLLMPFSNARFAIGSVSVVDPIYTIPLCLSALFIIMMRRTSSARRIINWAGIIVSSLYLLFTVYNKTNMNEVVRNTMTNQDISYERYTTSPTIANNILWSTTVEKDTSFLVGAYSRLDPQRRITKFTEIPKNHHLIKGYENDKHVAILKRFSNGYFALRHNQDSTSLEWIDLRWGTADNFINEVKEEDRFFVKYELKNIKGELVLIEKEKEAGGGMFDNLTKLPEILAEYYDKYPSFPQKYWDRLMGRWQ